MIALSMRPARRANVPILDIDDIDDFDDFEIGLLEAVGRNGSIRPCGSEFDDGVAKQARTGARHNGARSRIFASDQIKAAPVAVAPAVAWKYEMPPAQKIIDDAINKLFLERRRIDANSIMLAVRELGWEGPI